MKVSQAKEIAQNWVKHRITQLPNVSHAFFIASIMTREEEDELPTTSDVDIRIVVDQDIPPELITLTGELCHKYYHIQNVRLDVSYMSKNSLDKLSSNILGHTMATSFRKPNAIYDPNEQLDKMHQEVSVHYRDDKWVRQRCRKTREIAYSWFDQAENSLLHNHGWPNKRIERVSWLYMGATPPIVQIPCVANLQGITSHKCLVRSWNTLYQYGYPGAYQDILKILGLTKFKKSEVEASLNDLHAALKYARSVHKTRYYGDHNLHISHEPIVIEGPRNLIQNGFHREAMYFIAGIRNWIQNTMENDGTEPEKSHFDNTYSKMLTSIGIINERDIDDRYNDLKQYIPKMMDVANHIIEKNPDIIREK